jgi:hypothetical protein
MDPGVIDALPSVQSLYVTASKGALDLVQGTAFVVSEGGKDWLVTNWHVAAGRGRTDGQPMHGSGATPDTLKVWHNSSAIGVWRLVEYRLFDDSGQARWLEHPAHGRRVDAVALPLDKRPELAFHPYFLEPSEDELFASVADDVSIIGFPFGLRTAGSMGVWSRGSIASEIGLDYADLPCFLVDSRTRRGQSGSPVVVYSSGVGGHRMDSGWVIGPGPLVRLLGVYSGRINEESDLGFVWKTQALVDIIRAGIAGNGDLIDPRHPRPVE